MRRILLPTGHACHHSTSRDATASSSTISVRFMHNPTHNRRGPRGSSGSSPHLDPALFQKSIALDCSRGRGELSSSDRDGCRAASVSHSTCRKLAVPPPGRSDRVPACRKPRAARPPLAANARDSPTRSGCSPRSASHLAEAPGRGGVTRDTQNDLALVPRKRRGQVRRSGWTAWSWPAMLVRDGVELRLTLASRQPRRGATHACAARSKPGLRPRALDHPVKADAAAPAKLEPRIGCTSARSVHAAL
jgi:hypothetical protein